MLERDLEMAVLGGALDEGPGVAVLIEAPAGSGKSTLLHWAAQTARDRGLTVFRAAGSPLDAELSFGLVRQLLDRALPVASFEGMAAPSAAVVGGPGHPAPADVTEAVHALYWLLVNLSADGRIVLVVDDVHLADEASLRFLEYVVRRIDGLPLTLVMAGRPAPVSPTLTSLRARTRMVLSPRPLSTDAVETLVRERFGEADPAFSAACHSASGGNPLLVTELLAATPANGTPQEIPSSVPEGVRRRVESTLADLGDEARGLCAAVATLHQAPLELAAALAGLPPLRAAEVARDLRAVGLLAPDEPLRFVHALHAQAVEGTDQADWHARAAELLAARGEPPEAVAPHLMRTLPAGRPETVVTLRRAAAVARSRGDSGAAHGYLARALEEPAPADQQPELALELAAALGSSAQWPAAAGALRRGLVAGGEHFALQHALGRAEHHSGRHADAVAALQAAVAIAPTAADRSDAESDLVAVALADAQARPAVAEILDRGEAPLGAAAAILACEPSAAPAEELRTWLRTVDLHRAARHDLALGWAILALDAADGTLDALAIVQRGVAAARTRGDAASLAYFLVMEGWLLYRLGRIDEAQAATADVEALDAGTFTLQVEALCLAHVLIERDQAAEAVALAGAALVDSPTEEFLATVRHVEGRGNLALGRSEVAFGHLLAAGTALEPLQIFSPVFNAWRVWFVRAAQVTGEAGRAAEHAAHLMRFADRSGVPSVRTQALACTALVAPDDAVELLDAALAIAAAGPFRLDEARLLLRKGMSVAQRGDKAAARDPLRAALDIADRHGATATAKLAQRELIAAGGRPRRAALTGVASLSPGELRVARLAAEGLKNREIAEQLWVTVKTVELHLRNTYAKLEVDGRAGLAEAFRSDR